MDEENFYQGMLFDVAIEFNLGYGGLQNQDAIDSFTTSFAGLSSRPDWDGYLTLKEANEWYRNGEGQPLFVALDKIDMFFVPSFGEKDVGRSKYVNLLLFSASPNDGLVYGNIELERCPNHTVKAKEDIYDFDMKSCKNPSNWGRNIETKIGEKVAGQGISYRIYLYGDKKLTPILPWVK